MGHCGLNGKWNRDCMTLTGTIRVVVIEDDRRIREGLVELLGSAKGMRVVGSFGSAEEGLAGLPELKPDVVLLDIGLPGMSGIEAVGRIRVLVPGAAVLMLTVYEDAERIFRALQCGARGYLLKRTAPARLVEAVVEVHGGGAPMSPQVARKVVQFLERPAGTAEALDRLSPREREVLEELCRGALYKEIAGTLGIGVETVRGYLSSIYAKLHVRSRTEAVIKYLGTPGMGGRGPGGGSAG